MTLCTAGLATTRSHKYDIPLLVLRDAHIAHHNRLPVQCWCALSVRHHPVIPVATRMSLPPVSNFASHLNIGWNQGCSLLGSDATSPVVLRRWFFVHYKHHPKFSTKGAKPGLSLKPEMKNQPKIPVRPSKSWKEKHIGTDMHRGRPQNISV